MLTTLQLEMVMAVSMLVYGDEGFEKFELVEGAKTLNEFKRCTIKQPRDEDYGNGCALITRKIDGQWYVGIANIWIGRDSRQEEFNVISYKFVHEQELKYKTTLMLTILKWVDRVIGDDSVYTIENGE